MWIVVVGAIADIDTHPGWCGKFVAVLDKSERYRSTFIAAKRNEHEMIM